MSIDLGVFTKACFVNKTLCGILKNDSPTKKNGIQKLYRQSFAKQCELQQP